MSLAELNTLYSQAVAALDGDDYAGAIRAATKAKLRLATMPDVSRVAGQGGSQSMAWANVQAIDSFIAQVEQMATSAQLVASAGPFLQTRIAYARPDAGDDA